MTRSADLSRRIAAAGDAGKKEWWERYLKGEIEFFGVPMGDIRRVTKRWGDEHDLAPEELRSAAFELLRRPIAEEKLAGILIMQELLLPADELDAGRDFPVIAALFDDGHIWEWNTTDWLCVRVLGPMIRRDGRPTARMLARWTAAPGLWRRRAAAVSFVPVASQGDELFRGLVDVVIDVCAANVVDPERFAQTGVGWVLRDLSDAAPQRVFDFILANRNVMSREAVRMASARLPDDQRTRLGITGPRRRR
ncbi:MAG TPA: DNA alkylation repair protein [Acidimicrobiia bacterium]|jgi:3-methyladenine DNA glycosylase AlkD|nr:DNA alkylation repair protein [Acidimicrobiia bacterium]